MSRAQKSGKKLARSVGDITLNDFANATVCKKRPKKSNVNAVLKEFERLDVDDKSWDEKPDESDGEFVPKDNEDGTVSYVITKAKEKGKKRKIEESLDKVGYNLPIDIWLVIGKFIKPEDVGRFAGICKSSYSVACTAKFWIDLYQRYHRNDISLPDDLKPDHLKRKFGVRTVTVRSLFLMYKPFTHTLWRAIRQERHPRVLLKRKCVLMWYSKTSKAWSFHFKLEKTGMENHQQRYRNADLIEKLDDVFANPDENCTVLLVNSSSFIAIPPVQNYILCDVNMSSLSSNLLQNRLKLKFSSSVYCGRQGTDGAGIVEFTIRNVINVKVLDWWHEKFPRTSTLEIFLNGD